MLACGGREDRERSERAQRTLYSTSPLSETWMNWRLASMPWLTSTAVGISMRGRQNVPSPVWLNSGTRVMVKSVLALTPEPRPRLTEVRAQGCSGLRTRAPPERGQAVRSVVEASRPPPTTRDWLGDCGIRVGLRTRILLLRCLRVPAGGWVSVQRGKWTCGFRNASGTELT